MASEAEGVDEAATDEGRQAELQAVAAGRPFAVPGSAHVLAPRSWNVRLGRPRSGGSNRRMIESIDEEKFGGIDECPEQVFARLASSRAILGIVEKGEGDDALLRFRHAVEHA